MPPHANLTTPELVPVSSTGQALEAPIDPLDSRALIVASLGGKHVARVARRACASRLIASLRSIERRGLTAMMAVWPKSRL